MQGADPEGYSVPCSRCGETRTAFAGASTELALFVCRRCGKHMVLCRPYIERMDEIFDRAVAEALRDW